MMRKALTFLTGVALLAVACQKAPEPVDGSLLFDYQPSSQTVEVVGTLTPASYDWITMSQTDNKVTFTVKLNLTGGVRTATYAFANSSAKYSVTQKTGTSDAAFGLTVKDYDGEKFNVNVNISTKEKEYYSGWGVGISKSTDRSGLTEVAGSGMFNVGDNSITVKPADDGLYYIWAYVTSTGGDKIWSSNYVPLIPAFTVKAGEDLQAKIDAAPEGMEIRVAGGAVFNGPVKILANNKNKIVSGGWNEDFTQQSLDNLSVIDGGGANVGFIIADSDQASAAPLQGDAEISYFEIRNCKNLSSGGSAVIAGIATVDNKFYMHHCFVHDNEAKRGTIYTLDGSEAFSGTYVFYANVIANNLVHGHAAAIEFSDGRDSDGAYVRNQGIMVGNILANNISDTPDGYAGSVMVQSKTDLLAVNNTIVNTFNWRENNGSVWQSFYCRGYGALAFANNILVANWENCQGWDGYKHYEANAIIAGGVQTIINSVIEGDVGVSWPDRATVKDNYIQTSGFDVTTVLKNPEVNGIPGTFTYKSLSDFIGGNYAPLGDALGNGTLAEDLVWYNFGLHDENKKDKWNHTNIKKLITEEYPNDINGKPFVSGGKAVIGAFAE